MKKSHIGRRRGTSVAAAALSFALVAPFAQPVAFAAETGSEVNTVDGHTAKCGLDPNDPMARYNTQLVNTEGAEVVDAIANGYTTSVTDFTNAKHTVSGFVGVGGYGTITPGTGRFVEDGTRVFMQWMDEDGTVSPVYETQTHKVGTRQGRFAFDLRDGFTDSNGNFHQFRAVSSQLIRIWAEPQVEKRSGLLMYPMRTAPGLTTGQWQSAFPAKHGTFPLVGTNYQRAHIWMGYLPIDPETGKNFMMAEEVSENPLVGRNAEGRDLGTVTGDEVIVGRVWHETGLGADQANIVTGPAFKTPASTSKDTPAVGYKVYFTTLTEEGITGLANAHEQDMFVRPGAVADLVKEHPEWLRKTWVATTDETGQYALDLKGDYDEVAKNRGYYAWVEDASGTVVQTHSVGAPMEFKFNFSRQASNWVAFPTPNRLSGAVASMNFAVTGSPEANNLALHVVNFDNMNNLAHREDVAKLAIDGALPGTANRIVWTNAAGKVVDPATGEPIEGVDPRDPDVGTQIEQCGDEANASLTVPKSAKDGDTFTAWFYAGPNPIAADSFSVTADQAAEVDPRYGDVHWDEDPETDGYQSLPPKFFKEDRDGVKVDKENDVTDSVEGEKYEFAPTFRMPLRDENGDPIEEQARNADGSPQFATEPVVDENGDPVLDDEGNPQEKQVLDEAGNPVPVMEQKIGVPEGFEIDPETGVVTIPENYLPKDGEDPVVVPVRVTYADGSVDVADVKFFPKKAYNDVFEPSYDTKLVDPAKDPAVSNPKFTKNGEPFEKVPAGSKFELKNEDGSDWTVPEGYTVTVDPETGDVTVKADPEKIKELGEDGKPVVPEEFDVPVKVTYPDGTVDDATAKFQLDTDGDGEPDVTDEDDDNDGIPDSEDKNPRDPEVGNDAYVYEPKYDQDGSGKPGEDVTVDKPVFKDKDGKDTKAPEGTKFTPGENVPDGVTIDENTGEIKVTIPEDAKPGDKITVPVVVTYPDGTTDTVDVPVTVENDDAPVTPGTEKTTVDSSDVTPVDPTDQEQDTGIKVTNPDNDTKVSAKDEDGNDVPVKIDEDGNVVVTPGKGVDGPITVTIEDPDLPEGKVEVEVPVKDHEKGRDDNGSNASDKTTVDPSGVKPVDPTDKEQDTGIKVTNPDDDTKVSAKDEDDNDVPVKIDENGNVVVTPGENVDGPIDVTITDPDLPDGKVEVEVPVNGHEKGKDDNGSEASDDKTTVDETGKNPVEPTDEKQGTGVVVENEDDETKVTAKDEDGKDIPVVINPDTGEVEVTPGTDVDGPINVTIEDPDLPNSKVEVEIDVNGHEKNRDDNGSDPANEDGTKVDGSNITPVDPTDEQQDTGIKVTNPDEDTKVTAKDEDGNDVPVKIDEDGKVVVTPGEKVDGPITVTIEDPDLPNSKAEFEVPVNGHEKGRDDNGSDASDKTTVDQNGKKSVDPTDEKQGTGVKVTNPDNDTKVSAKDEDGKDIPVEINPNTGEIVVTPGTDVDGPITVTIEDPDLDGGKTEVEIDVNGHEKGRDDNGSDASDDKTTVSPGKSTVTPNGKGQNVGKVDQGNSDKKGELTAELVDKDGNLIKDAKVTIDKDGNIIVSVPKGTPAGEAWVVVKEDGKEIHRFKIQIGETIDTGKCVATSVGFGLPLIALLPLGLATQIEIPGLSDFAAQANAQIQNANTQLQQQLGIFNPQLAAQVEGLNKQLGQYGTDIATVAGGLALIAAGILAGTIIYDNCTPGGGSSVKDLELKGSSGKTYAGSSKEEKAPATTQKAEPKN
ncbi:YPDG domain-containing protein [uncultured Corynebacterium sp.]|uniref:YPDG domain-containing protein n=1 Tax=uncultured Corynebacterium sp. TaxID=159447 RepID=UPI00288B2E80|nr:YPDG domain-containing protein [uncultured Corynebacterium sp.]